MQGVCYSTSNVLLPQYGGLLRLILAGTPSRRGVRFRISLCKIVTGLGVQPRGAKRFCRSIITHVRSCAETAPHLISYLYGQCRQLQVMNFPRCHQ